MEHAVYVPPFGTFGDVHTLVELAVAAEAAGWDGFFTWDHMLYEHDVPFADPWIALAAVACATERVRLGPLVTPLSRRRVWKVAREAVTLDHLSRGRLTLGVGLGIDFWREFSAFHEAAVDDRRRAQLVDEGIELLRRLWSGDEVTYEGLSISVDRARLLPTPVQSPGVPIWSAALWPMRPGPRRRAALCEGVMPFSPAGPIKPQEIAGLRERLGVGPEFDICLHGPPSSASEYAEAGVSWFCLSLLPDEPLDEVRRLVDAGPPR